MTKQKELTVSQVKSRIQKNDAMSYAFSVGSMWLMEIYEHVAWSFTLTT